MPKKGLTPSRSEQREKQRGNPDKIQAYKWKPGQSGNPGGRPKRDVAAEIAEAVFEKNEQAIYNAMLKALKKGNPKVFLVLADRAFGKLRERIELGGDEELLAALEAGRKRVAAAKAGQGPSRK